MKLISALTFALLIAASPLHAADEYTFDKPHTHILFKIGHSGFSKFIAEFLDYDGTIMLDEETPEKSKVNVTIRPTGIKTDLENFDKKLWGKDFFNTENFPTATFTSTRIVKTGEKTADITGDFTFLGVTKPLTLHATLNKMGYDKWRKRYKAGFSLTGRFNRSDWGFNTYIPDVSDEVLLEIETEIDRALKEGESY